MKIIGLIVAIALLLIVSGCMGTAPKSTPAPTSTYLETPAATPLKTAPVPTATAVPTANPEITAIKPSIIVTSYSTSVTGESNFTINWEVSGGGTISKTMILWGFKSGGENITDYLRNSTIQTGQTPGTFSTEMKAPSGGGPIYFRAYAVVDGTEIYSLEYQIIIIPRYTGEGGGGGGY
ncbi:MAG TPA: hypothetical protein VIO11_08940 [Candidatus Methanoperedens sp.]